MGNKGIHAEAAEPDDAEELASYIILSYPAKELPHEYLGLIYSSWLRSLRNGNDAFKLIDAQAYYRHYHPYIGHILAHPDATIRMATLSDDKDVVLGFSVTRGQLLDYVWVQYDFRRLGIGKMLVPYDITTITHFTRTALTIWNNKYSYWKLNPFI